MLRAPTLLILATLFVSAPLHARPQIETGEDSASNPSDEEEEDEEDEEDEEEEGAKLSFSPGALPTLAAIVPGILLHGSGHYVAGDTKTAIRLLKWQAIGLSLSAASSLYLGLSGGSRYGNEISIPMLVSGSGLMLNTFVADIFGSAGGGNGYHYKKAANQSATLGYAYIHDPIFAYRHFSRAAALVEMKDFRVAPLLWTAFDDNNQRARLPISYRGWTSEQGEYVEATTAFTYHHFGSEDFSTYVGEFSVGGRVEMQRIGESLRGSFATMSVGAGWQVTDYSPAGIGSDGLALLLGHYGYGFYLPKSGELEMYYEHRRDTFTAGTSPSSRNGSGFLGHFGIKLRQPLSPQFAIQAQAEIGSAYLLTTGLEVQWGQR